LNKLVLLTYSGCEVEHAAYQRQSDSAAVYLVSNGDTGPGAANTVERQRL